MAVSDADVLKLDNRGTALPRWAQSNYDKAGVNASEIPDDQLVSQHEAAKEMENLFEKNLQRIPNNKEVPNFNPMQDASSDDELDKIVKMNQRQSEYAKRFIDYNENEKED